MNQPAITQLVLEANQDKKEGERNKNLQKIGLFLLFLWKKDWISFKRGSVSGIPEFILFLRIEVVNPIHSQFSFMATKTC